MKLTSFFANHPVFTHQEYIHHLERLGDLNQNTKRELLVYHIKKNNVMRIRRGLYAVVPAAFEKAKQTLVDPLLVAGRITPDAVIAYHSALDVYGVSHSIFHDFYYCSTHTIKSFDFQWHHFQRIPFPKTLRKKKQLNFATQLQDRLGLNVRVCKLERTLVDCLTRPELAGGWEEIWQSVTTIPTLDIELVIDYALLLDNATTTAKVGLFLEIHHELFSVNEKHLSALERHKPRTKHYMQRAILEKNKFIKRWNLIVPISLLEQYWEEPNDPI